MTNTTRNHPSSSAHRALQPSTTLSRRYVKRPAIITSPANKATSQSTARTANPPSAQPSPQSSSASTSSRDLALRRRQAIAAKINRERLDNMRRDYLATTSIKSSIKNPTSTSPKTSAKPGQKLTEQKPNKNRLTSASAENAPLKTSKKPLPTRNFFTKTEQNPNLIESSTSRSAKSSLTKLSPARSTESKANTNAKVAPSAPKPHPYEALVRARLRAKAAEKAPKPLPTAKELKDKAITDALRSVAAMSETAPTKAKAKAKIKTPNPKQHFFQGRRALLALSCALASVPALGYLVHRNFPDISVRVTAMQAGFDVRYPSFIPEGYHIAGITSEKPAKVTMEFVNDQHHFTLSEERSAWDSQSLLHNFVKPTWNDRYTTAREQGITVFLSGKTNACWVNGGVLYKITTSGHLDKLQLHNIIHSL